MKRILAVLGIISLTSVTGVSVVSCGKKEPNTMRNRISYKPNIAKMNSFEIYVGATDQQIQTRTNDAINIFLRTNPKTKHKFNLFGDSRLDSQGKGSIIIAPADLQQQFEGEKEIQVTKRKLINVVSSNILGSKIYQSDKDAETDLLNKFKEFTTTEIDNGRLRDDVPKLEALVDIVRIKELQAVPLDKDKTSNRHLVRKEIQVKIKPNPQSPYEAEELAHYYFVFEKSTSPQS